MLQAALERAPMRAWPFGPAPTSARPWLWRPLGALRDNLVFLSLALSALSFALNFRSSKPGRVLQAVKTIRKPFRPELAKDRIAERDVVDSIAKRIENWMGHATIIAGRFGSGKTVALEEALRDRRGVYVHTIRDKDWEKSLYYDLGLDNLTMLKNVLRLVRKRNQGSTPSSYWTFLEQRRRDVGDFGCFVFDSLGCRHGYRFQLGQDSVVGRIACPRRDPKTQPPCFAVLRQVNGQTCLSGG